MSSTLHSKRRRCTATHDGKPCGRLDLCHRVKVKTPSKTTVKWVCGPCRQWMGLPDRPTVITPGRPASAA